MPSYFQQIIQCAHLLFNSIRFNEIRLEALEADNTISLDLNFTFFDFVIQRVINPTPQLKTALFRRRGANAQNDSLFNSFFFVLLLLKGILQEILQEDLSI